MYIFTGTRLQNTRNENKKKDVVGEHEDQAHSPRYHHCLDSDHYSLGLSWVQVYLNLETIRRLYYERLSAPYCSTRLMETPHRVRPSFSFYFPGFFFFSSLILLGESYTITQY